VQLLGFLGEGVLAEFETGAFGQGVGDEGLDFGDGGGHGVGAGHVGCEGGGGGDEGGAEGCGDGFDDDDSFGGHADLALLNGEVSKNEIKAEQVWPVSGSNHRQTW